MAKSNKKQKRHVTRGGRKGGVMLSLWAEICYYTVMIFFTAYAHRKFLILERHGVIVCREEVAFVVGSPDAADDTKKPLIFARKKLDDGRILCAVYKKEEEIRKIITFYPV